MNASTIISRLGLLELDAVTAKELARFIERKLDEQAKIKGQVARHRGGYHVMKDSKPLTVWQKPRRFTPEYQKWFATKVVEHYIELLKDKVGDDWHLAKADLLTFIEKDCGAEDTTS